MTIALVVGGAECVAEDMKAALALFTPDRIYAVNDIGAHLETLHVWCTLHPEFMDGWEAQRKARGLANGYEIVAPLPGEVGKHGNKGRITRRVSYRWPKMNSSASSGIYGAKVALDDGHRVVLAGIPLDGSNHFLREKPWGQRECFMPGFDLALPFLKGRVKSMSGHTMKVLGAPTPKWLAGAGDPAGTNTGAMLATATARG